MALTKTTQHAAPDRNSVRKGKFTLVGYHLHEAAVAAPVVPVAIEGIQGISFGDRSFTEKEVFHFGGGNVRRIIRDSGKMDFTLKFLPGYLDDLVAALFGQTWTSAGDTGLLHEFPTYPLFDLELVARDHDNQTALASLIIPDVEIKSWKNDMGSLDELEGQLVCHTEYPYFWIPSNTHFVLDKFDGTGAAVDFNTSETMLDIVAALTGEHQMEWDYTNMVYIKEKLLGEDCGTRVATYTVTPLTPKITAGAAPAATTDVYAGYVAVDA